MFSIVTAAALLLPYQAPKLTADVDADVCWYTVRVRNQTNKRVGNGVLISRSFPKAYVLTSAHIVDEGDAIVIELFPQGKMPVKITDVKLDKRSDPQQEDLAVLSFVAEKDTVPTWMRIAAPKQLPDKKSFKAFSAAATDKLPPQTRNEQVLDVVLKNPGADKATQYWKAKALPELGRSGGPLFDAEGRLLGICSGGDEKGTYYTHRDEIHRFLKRAFVPLPD